VEIKYQPESNLQHPEPLDHGKVPHNMLHGEKLRAATATKAAMVKVHWRKGEE
jgi:hypothetical protein